MCWARLEEHRVVDQEQVVEQVVEHPALLQVLEELIHLEEAVALISP